MQSELEKMRAGALYNPMDPQLAQMRLRARLLTQALNSGREDDTDERSRILKELLPHAGDKLWLQPPFYCDYGVHIHTGEGVFFNFNCVVLDVARVSIGSRSLFGPNVQIYTATHPTDHQERASGLELGRPIDIGSDVWVGGSAVICPGVSIGDRSIIGAGSVVTRDIPEGVIAAGNPCRVIRSIGPGPRPDPLLL